MRSVTVPDLKKTSKFIRRLDDSNQQRVQWAAR